MNHQNVSLTSRAARRPVALFAGTFAVAALAGLLALPSPAAANPFFQSQTGLQCAACHQPGRETAGEAGLNPYGGAFLRCRYNLPLPDGSCAVSPIPPQPVVPVADGTTRTQGGTAKFEDTCSAGDFFVVRMGGSPSAAIRFKLLNSHKVHLEVPVGSTYAAACGGYVGADGRFDYIGVE